MRLLTFAVFCFGLMVAGTSAAQTPPATIGQPYVPSPWWMRDPVIASIGAVRTEIAANRATFQITFEVVDRNVSEATQRATERVRSLSRSLGGYGVDSVRVETTVVSRPLHEQYRDNAGILRENVRPDQIDRYVATASVNLQVRNAGQLEQIYADVLAADPTSVSGVSFSLEPTNAQKTELAEAAVRDAARRARAAAAAAGASLGPVRVIDPTGRACQTDVLAGWPSYGAAAVQAADVVVTGSRIRRDEFAPAGPVTTVAAEHSQEGDRLTLQRPSSS